jgi:hypothetical protein
MVRQALKSKVVSGFAQMSGLALMGGTFVVVIGCPYSDQIREVGFWIGAALVMGLTLYAASHITTRFKAIFNAMLSQGYRLANIPGTAITAMNSLWQRIWPPQTIQAQSLRLPPDIFRAKKMAE